MKLSLLSLLLVVPTPPTFILFVYLSSFLLSYALLKSLTNT